MRVIRAFPQREIEQFGSHGFTHSRLARGEVQVAVAGVDGLIGAHPTTSRQLLVVLDGRVAVRTHDDQAELHAREAVLWERGEWHETRSLEPSRVLIVEGAFEVLDQGVTSRGRRLA